MFERIGRNKNNIFWFGFILRTLILLVISSSFYHYGYYFHVRISDPHSEVKGIFSHSIIEISLVLALTMLLIRVIDLAYKKISMFILDKYYKKQALEDFKPYFSYKLITYAWIVLFICLGFLTIYFEANVVASFKAYIEIPQKTLINIYLTQVCALITVSFCYISNLYRQDKSHIKILNTVLDRLNKKIIIVMLVVLFSLLGFIKMGGAIEHASAY
jgi:hypothetical protein